MKIIFLIAGEPSGDKLGANLIRSMKEFLTQSLGEEQANAYKFLGIGGELMQAEGFESLFDYSQLSVMGLMEILPKIKLFNKLINDTVNYANSLSITAFISIDSPGFTMRVAKKLKKLPHRNYPLIHYVAPSVWAWKPKRAKAYSLVYDRILCLLPFEPPYFHKHNLRANFVGHPASSIKKVDSKDFVEKYQLNPAIENIVLVLPGSRKSEVTRLLPYFSKSAHMINDKIPHCKFIIPALPHLKDYITQHLKSFPIDNTLIVDGITEGSQAMAISKVSLASSGTVALELATYQVAQTTAYRMAPLTYVIVNSLLQTDHVNLINIINDQQLIKERIQSACTAETLANDIIELLTDEHKRTNQNNFQQIAMDKLTEDPLKIAEYIFEEVNLWV